MQVVEIKRRLIEKIKSLENETLLKEAFRLVSLETDNTDVYKLSDKQREIINEAREQIASNQYLTEEQANREIEEWLNK